MLSSFQETYQRVEQSLQRLTDSIASYNPSVRDAVDLVAADDEINEKLDELKTHQTNYLRIQQLRQTTEALDDHIRTTTKLIADTRRDITSIPSSMPEENKQELAVSDLLAYAKFISRTTVPPTTRKDIPSNAAIKTSTTPQPQNANGIATPPAAAVATGHPDAPHEPLSTSALTTEQKTNLNPTLEWEPWPSHPFIAAGALAQIQRMVENGQDPASVLTAEEQAERDKIMKDEEELEKRKQEEAEKRRMSLFDTSGGSSAVRRRPTLGDVFDPDDE